MNTNKDHSVIKCRECGLTKVRILAGKYNNGKDKKWTDENGLEWNGHTCSTCHVDKARKRKQLKKKNGYL